MNIEDLKSLMDAFDPASLLPEIENVLDVVLYAVRMATLVGPAVLLLLGLGYLIFAPKEANYYFGYRCMFGMGSVEAWRFTQKLAGAVWAVLGLGLTVVMVLITGSFSGKEIMDVISTGFSCLIWEIVLAAVSCIGINLTAAIRFNRRGERRAN